MCDHQGAIIEQTYLAAQIHKELRLARQDKDLGKVRVKLEEIDNDLPRIFQDAWRFTVSTMNSYFERTHKSNFLPRMCIKVTETKKGKKHIVDVFRENGSKSKLTYKVEENTGFTSVENDGIFYVCNDIPTGVIKNGYANPRLNANLANRYNPGFFGKLKQLSPENSVDAEWAECWKDYSQEKGNGSSCYKSTLIVPMTLINNTQSSRFIKKTMVGSKKDRLIYGFLYLDHTEKDYFTDDDINISYVVADLLAFYMISGLNFTEYSTNYAQAKKEVMT